MQVWTLYSDGYCSWVCMLLWDRCYHAEENELEINCITEHVGFEPVFLNVWVLQAGYFMYKQHYGTGDIQHNPQHEYVFFTELTVPFSIHTFLLQAIQVHCVSSTYKLVLGLAGKKSTCYVAKLCRKCNKDKVSIISLYWLQVPTNWMTLFMLVDNHECNIFHISSECNNIFHNTMVIVE